MQEVIWDWPPRPLTMDAVAFERAGQPKGRRATGLGEWL